MFVCRPPACSASLGQKRASYPMGLGLEPQVFVSTEPSLQLLPFIWKEDTCVPHSVGLSRSLLTTHTSLFKICLSLSAMCHVSPAHQGPLVECHQHNGMDWCPVCDQVIQGPPGWAQQET